MTNVILCGCGGRMGRAVSEAISNDPGLQIIAGVDTNATSLGSVCSFPVYDSIFDFPGKADVIIDFSHHSALSSLCAYAKKTNTPIVVATTGHTEDEQKLMQETSLAVPIFFSRNMSIGINLIIEVSRRVAKTLGVDFDIEIIEKHHNKKLDAPSGTALMIAEALAEERESTTFVYDRHSVRAQRDVSEIGIHSVRGGTIVGEHEVIFAGKDEIVSLKHEANSREIFALGATKAAEFIVGKTSGLYSMSDLINQ